MLLSKNQSVCLSSRISKEQRTILREVAEQKGISVNALVNRIFSDYAEIWRWHDLFGLIMLAPKTLTRIVDSCPDDELVEIAEHSGSLLATNTVRTIGIVPTFINVLEFVKKSGTKAHWFKYNHHVMGQKLLIQLNHYMSRKWSIFLAHQVSTVFKTLLNKDVQHEIFDNSVTLMVKLSQSEIESIST